MDDERQVRPGFLPPKAPGGADAPRFQAPERPAPARGTGLEPTPEPPAADRPAFVSQRMESGARSPVAITGTAVGAVSILLLVMSLGVAYVYSLMFSLMALGFGLLARKQIAERGEGRAGQARAAIWVAGIGLGLAFVAMIVWIVLEANGFAPEELEPWLREQLEGLEERRDRTNPGDTRS